MSDHAINKKIIIVESPRKAKTLKTYFKEYDIFATKGHFRTLQKPKGITYNTDKSIDFSWDIDKKKIKEIISHISNNDHVFIATDLDREGEGIAYHIQELLNQYNLQTKIDRIRFSEISKKAIITAIEHPTKINSHLVNAYLARLALDFRYGFEASPLLWKCIAPRLSFGRVQNPTLNLLFERYLERKNFKSVTSYSLEAHVRVAPGCTWIAKYFQDNLSKEQLIQIQQELPDQLLISAKTTKKLKQSPKAPFITSTMQQAAVTRMNKSLKVVMQLAQKLYEGIEINGQQQALITYMRTDSVHISQDGLDNIKNYITKNFTQEYVLPKPNIYTNKTKNSQEAHECIRPIDMFITPESIKEYLTEEQLELYQLIWLRALQSQMPPALKQVDRYQLKHNEHIFYYSQSYILFPGYLINYDIKPQEIDINQYYPLITTKVLEHHSQPPANYTEASLVKTLEQLGIGRPSTFSSIIDKLKMRKYGLFIKKSIQISQLGLIVCFFNSLFFKEFSDYHFTSAMEVSLDLISQNKEDQNQFLVKQFDQLANTISNIDQTIKEKQTTYKNILVQITKLWNQYKVAYCYKCDGEIELRSKFSVFMFCPNCQINIPLDTEISVYEDGLITHYLQLQYKKITYKDQTVNISCKLIIYNNDFLWKYKTQLIENIDNIKELYQTYKSNQLIK